MTSTTRADVRHHGSWQRLEALAQTVVADVSKAAGMTLQPLLGGGTRLMLALEHRISGGIDLFIRDPQWIGFLSPRLNDHVADLVGDRYDEDANSLKLRLKDGEIDFIVAMSLLGLPADPCLTNRKQSSDRLISWLPRTPPRRSLRTLKR